MADTLTVIDNRTGRKIELRIEHGAIRATDLAQLGIVSYDPALLNTAACKSKVSYIDGERGILRYRAHPMGILIATVGALSTFYPEARNIMDLESRRMQTRRLIGKMPTIAAFAYRHSRGLPYVYPDNDLSYTGNFLSMMFKMTE